MEGVDTRAEKGKAFRRGKLRRLSVCALWWTGVQDMTLGWALGRVVVSTHLGGGGGYHAPVPL